MEYRSRERLLVLVAVLCVGGFLADKVLITPLFSMWKERSKRITELKQDLKNGKDLVDREEGMKKRWRNMLDSSLPNDTAEAEEQVLGAMSRWTQESRISVNSLKPRWIEDDDEMFKKIECRVTAEGGIMGFARFLYELERDPLALRVEEIELTSSEDDGRALVLGVRFTGLILMEEQG